MEKLKEMAPLGVFIVPVVVLSLIVIPLAIFAPVSFCAAIDANNSELMDGWGGSSGAHTLFPLCLGWQVSAIDTAIAFWIGVFASAGAIMPYVLLRRSAKGENWRTAAMHAYLPWLAAVLVLLGTFGVG